MKNLRWLTACMVLGLTGTACADLDVANVNEPNRAAVEVTAGDLQALLYGGFQNWWGIAHHNYPASALSVAADAHSSSWGNWGMRDSGWEPRKAYNNNATYSYNEMAEAPWRSSYRSLAAVRDVFRVMSETGIELEGGARADAFGSLIQAMTLANLAVIFDRAYIIDETVEDVLSVELSDYNAVWAAAEDKFGEAIQVAENNTFTIPSAWVGYNGNWSSAYMAEIARTYRARYRTQVPRTPAERGSVDWRSVLRDAGSGISRDFAGNYTAGGNWAWHRSKLHTATWSGWARMDYRTIGPADASGAWETWINASHNDKRPFHIDTDDRRITGGQPNSHGEYIRYRGNSPFPASRGIYHFSHYIDRRWDYLRFGSFIGEYPDMTAKELEFLVAEAAYRTGDMETTMATVNKYRTENGKLPPFTDPRGVAPGGDRCVPQMADGSCGDLWEAYKYEKRIELFHYGFGTEYFDDRGWGDLVTHTFSQLPIPGRELDLLFVDVYTFGGPNDPTAAPDAIDRDFLGDISPDAIKVKMEALEAAMAHDMDRIDDFRVVRK